MKTVRPQITQKAYFSELTNDTDYLSETLPTKATTIGCKKDRERGRGRDRKKNRYCQQDNNDERIETHRNGKNPRVVVDVS